MSDTCKHPRTQTWRFADDGNTAPLWSCVECGRKFEPVSAPAPAPAEPVAWQWRRKGEPWSLDKTFNSQVYATTPDSEVRPLYAAPAAPAGWQPAGFDEALGKYAAAVRAMDSDGMRAGYVALRAMLAAAPGAPQGDAE